eukprot:1159888-Pelagomonas_calceolata.AAC.5
MHAYTPQIMGQVSAARQLPPHNLEACNAWDAYPWETLVPGDAAGSIRPGRLLKAAQEYEVEQDMREKRKVRVGSAVRCREGGPRRCRKQHTAVWQAAQSSPGGPRRDEVAQEGRGGKGDAGGGPGGTRWERRCRRSARQHTAWQAAQSSPGVRGGEEDVKEAQGENWQFCSVY